MAASPQSGSFCLFRHHFIDPTFLSPLLPSSPESLWLLGIHTGIYRTLGHRVPDVLWVGRLEVALQPASSPTHGHTSFSRLQQALCLKGRPKSSVTRFSHLMWGFSAWLGVEKRREEIPPVLAGLRGSLWRRKFLGGPRVWGCGAGPSLTQAWSGVRAKRIS